MRIYQALVLAALMLLGSGGPGAARMHAQMYCWAQDSEFPVACEQEDDEDDGSGLRVGSDPSRLAVEIQTRR